MKRDTNLIRRLEHLSDADQLRELELSLEKRLQGDDIAVFQYLKGTHEKTGEGFCQGYVDIGQERMALN